MRKAGLILFFMTLPMYAQPNAVYRSLTQNEYLKDIKEYPLQFEIPIPEADDAMNAIEGYLAKNMAHFYYVSKYAIQAQVGRVYMNVSRIDYGGKADIEFVISPSISSRGSMYMLGGVGAAGTILNSNHKNAEGYALAAIVVGALAAAEDRAEVKRSLKYAMFLARVTVKFVKTGRPYPTATLEEILTANIPNKLLSEAEAESGDYKMVKSYKVRGEPNYVNIVKHGYQHETKGAGFIFFSRNSKGQLKNYRFYKKK